MLSLNPANFLITTIHFCKLQDSKGALLGSNTGGFRGPGLNKDWWPQSFGPEVENLGNLLVLDYLPASVHLGIRIIAYGEDVAELRLTLTSNQDLNTPLLVQPYKIRFTPGPYNTNLPGSVSLIIAIQNFKVGNEGLYWVLATINNGPISKLPIYVIDRKTYEANFASSSKV